MTALKGEFTLFLSGVEPRENFEQVSSVTKNVLLSYYYIRRRGIDEIEERLKKHRGMKILIDSGAFTFFKDTKFQNKSVEWWETYLKNYTEFIKAHRDYIFACVELDIDSLVGSEQVEKWREKYFYPLEEEGINIIYLYHLDKDMNYFTELCKKHSYVGFSYIEIKRELQEQELVDETIDKLFNIAKKYNTAIHGFAITGNKMLLKHPFLSADSTTYLTGAQFGTITYFENGTLKHLDKDVWKTQYLEKLKALGLKEKLLLIESPYELIRANAISYKKFEEHIRNVMIAQRYWENRKTMYRLPDAEWFKSDMKDWQEKLEFAGIDKAIPENAGITLLQDMYIITNNTKEVSSYSLEDLVDLCALFNAYGTNYNTKDKCLKFLKIAFKEHLDGKRTDLQDLNRNAEENKRLALEREQYINDAEYMNVELSREECGELLPALLTAGYDKDSVEKELIEQGIKPVYDKDGNILKGIKTIKKQKKLSARALPRLSCDRCVMAMNCTEYKPGYICAFDKTFRKFDTRNVEDVKQGLVAIADLALERAQKAFMQETAMGGAPTKVTSQAMQDAWNYLVKLKELEKESENTPITVSQTKIKGGSIETTTVTGKNPANGGILEKIFLSDAIDAEVVEEK